MLMIVCGLGTTVHAQVDPGPNAGDTGSVVFTYLGNQVTYRTVRAADNNIWLQQNLGAPQVATAYNDPSAYGHNFQWGRWDDGHQVPGSDTARATILNPDNNPSGIPNGSDKYYYGSGAWWWMGADANSTWTDAPPSATNGTDPCAALGKHWRLGTQQEWVDILATESITGLVSAYASNLKLTAAGWRGFEWGTFANQGSFGNYWTSSVLGGYPVSVQIGSTTAPDQSLPGYGMSVRCMKTCTTPHRPAEIIGMDSICPGSTATYHIPAVDNALSYTWELPAGWNGSSTGDSITITATATGGMITVRANGSCDTGLAQELSVVVRTPPTPMIQVNQDTLSISDSYASYQWYRDDTLIDGGDGPAHIVTQNGSFRVQVTDDNGCTGSSDPYLVSNVHVGETGAAAHGIIIYPNPVQDMVYITAGKPVQASLHSMDGKILIQQQNATSLATGDLPAGIYILHIRDEQGMLLHTEKLIR